jgi:S-formylglutathione hydrolase FrmB
MNTILKQSTYLLNEQLPIRVFVRAAANSNTSSGISVVAHGAQVFRAQCHPGEFHALSNDVGVLPDVVHLGLHEPGTY